MAKMQKPKRPKFQARPIRKRVADTSLDEALNDFEKFCRDSKPPRIEPEAKQQQAFDYAKREALIEENEKKIKDLRAVYGYHSTPSESSPRVMSSIQKLVLEKYFNKMGLQDANYHIERALRKSRRNIYSLTYDEAETLVEYCRRNLSELLGIGSPSREGVCEDFWEEI